MLYSFFLTDDRNNLLRYAIADSTIIPANGFITFFVDGESNEGVNHTNFRLNRNGETIILSQKVGSVVNIFDSINYDYLPEDFSFGKYVDGTNNLQFMNLTPVLPNDGETPVINNISQKLINIYPNPSSGTMYIKLQNTSKISKILEFDIVDISGKRIYPKTLINNNIITIHLNHLYNGFYLFRIIEEGNVLESYKILLNK